MFRFQANAVTACLFLLTWPAWGQQGEPEPAPLAFAEVVQADGVHQDELYMRAKVWFAAAFVDSKQVLEVEDKVEGSLVGKGSIPYEPRALRLMPLRGVIVFTLMIMVKDGRFRYELSNFRHRGSESFVPGLGTIPPVDFGLITASAEPPKIEKLWEKQKQKAWEQMKQLSQLEAIRLIASLKTGMQTSSQGPEAW